MAQSKPKHAPKPPASLVVRADSIETTTIRHVIIDSSMPAPALTTTSVTDVAEEALRTIRTLEIELQVAMCGHLDQSQARRIAVMRAHFQRVIDGSV